MRSARRLNHDGRLLFALVVGGAVFGIATAVQADIPNNGVIDGCYGKPGTPYKGQLRVRDADQGEQCRYDENQLDWNQRGVRARQDRPARPDRVARLDPSKQSPPSGPGSVQPPASLTNQFNAASSTESPFTTMVSGKLHLTKAFDAYLDCSSGSALVVWWWIALDGTPVRSSLNPTAPGPPGVPITITGVTDSVVPAGSHNMRIEAMGDTGSAA